MNTDLMYKKELLIRKNRSKEFYGKYMEKIRDLLSIDVININFLSLEESDYIKKTEFRNKIYSRRYEPLENNDLIQNLKKNKESYYIFIDHDWEYCGCFEIDSLDIFKEDFVFGNYITDDLVFIENTLLSKIVLDYYEMNNQFFVDYEVYKN